MPQLGIYDVLMSLKCVLLEGGGGLFCVCVGFVFCVCFLGEGGGGYVGFFTICTAN